MKAVDTDPVLRDLLTACFDGDLTTHEHEQLQQRLKTDAAARELYLDYCAAHAALSFEYGVVMTPTTEPLTPSKTLISTPKKTITPSFWLWRKLSIAMAACLMVAISAFIWRNASASGPIVAQITNRAQVELLQQNRPWIADQLTADSYELRAGLLSFTYNNGVVVMIESPAQFTLSNNNSILLTRGRLSSQVPPSGIGFTVHTPGAEVIDLGTEFGVDVSSDGSSEVHVFKGLVNVRSASSPPGQHLLLATDQAARIADASLQPAGINMDKERFFRSFDEPSDNYPRNIRDLKPAAYYRFGALNGAVLRDVMGKAPGSLLLGTGSSAPWSPGVIGSAMRVAGKSTGRGAKIPQPSAFPNGTCTFIAWVRADARSDGGVIFQHHTEQQNLQLGFSTNNGQLQVLFRDQDGTQQFCRDPQALSLNDWHHIAVVIDASSLRLYRDGKPIANTQITKLSDQVPLAWWLGTDANGRYVWDGLIDECAVFHNILSDEVIRELAQRPPKH